MQWKAVTEVALIFILPVMLLMLGAVSVGHRYLLLALAACSVLAIVIAEGWTIHELGIRLDNLRVTALPYLLFTAAGVLILLAFALLLGQGPDPRWHAGLSFFALVIPLSILQEFMFRGFLSRLFLRLEVRARYAMLLNASLFALIHLIYPHGLMFFPLAILGGFCFAWMYHHYPNLPLISLSHSILNAVATFFLIFSFAR